MARTLLDKVWEAHAIRTLPSGQTQLLIGLHLIHEVTTPQAFQMLKELGLKVRMPERTFGTLDHIIPTLSQARPFADPMAEEMAVQMIRNSKDFGLPLFDLDSGRQGIVHVIGPELGLTQPGMTIDCGDSHTSTHGAVGAIAFGIGTSQVRDVLATQCLAMARPKLRQNRVEGALDLLDPRRQSHVGEHPRGQVERVVAGGGASERSLQASEADVAASDHGPHPERFGQRESIAVARLRPARIIGRGVDGAEDLKGDGLGSTLALPSRELESLLRQTPRFGGTAAEDQSFRPLHLPLLSRAKIAPPGARIKPRGGGMPLGGAQTGGESSATLAQPKGGPGHCRDGPPRPCRGAPALPCPRSRAPRAPGTGSTGPLTRARGAPADNTAPRPGRRC
jgi:hypothetical protein